MSTLLYLSADPGVPILGHKGASVHVREMVRAFHELGADVHIASARTGAEGDELDVPATLHQIPGVLPKKRTPIEIAEAVAAQAATVAELTREIRAEAIYERFSLFSAAGVRAAGLARTPHVLEVNAPLRAEAQRFRTLPHPLQALRYEREVLTLTDRILAVSEPLAARLAADGADRTKIAVAPNGVSPQRFPPRWRDPERFIVGFAGSMKAWHGIDTLVAAVAGVPEIHLEVAGHGPQEHLLDSLPPDRVTRYGALRHRDVMRVMSRWDVGVAPYRDTDGFWFSPMKLLEYMAAGACPVATALGEAPEVLGQGSRGVLVAPDDPAALAAALRSLVVDRRRAEDLGAKARDWVAANRTWQANAERALAILHEPRALAA